jgi:hypothetical protein
MSLIWRAPETGLLQLVVVPADVEASAPVSCPLHFMLVLDLRAHPVSFTLGAPLNTMELSSIPNPLPSERKQDVSACGSRTSAAALAAIGIDA